MALINRIYGLAFGSVCVAGITATGSYLTKADDKPPRAVGVGSIHNDFKKSLNNDWINGYSCKPKPETDCKGRKEDCDCTNPSDVF